MSGERPPIFKALAHPLRVRILAAIAGSRASPSDLAERLGEPLEHVGYHIRSLAGWGLIRMADRRRIRGAIEHVYELAEDPWISHDDVAALDQGQRDLLVRALLEVLPPELAAALELEQPVDVHISWSPLLLDERAWDELSRRLDEILMRAHEVQNEALASLKPEAVPPADALLTLMHFVGTDSTRTRSPAGPGGG